MAREEGFSLHVRRRRGNALANARGHRDVFNASVLLSDLWALTAQVYLVNRSLTS